MHRSKNKNNNTRYIKQAIKIVGLAGMTGMVIVAPNTAVAFDQLSKMLNKNTKRSYSDYLKRSGYFKVSKKGDNFVIRLSAKGDSKAKRIVFDDYELPKDKPWDGKWHLLMFDIPEKYNKYRKHIVHKLNLLGMKQVQDSVYAHYLPTKDLASIIRNQYPFMSSLVISASLDRIDGEDQLKKAFKL